MAGPPISHIASAQHLPEQVDVVVIGGGVIGLFTALELLERGQSVAIIEKGEFGAEQSSRNWGWIRVARRDSREIALVLEAQRLWRQLDQRINQDVGYQQQGIVFCADTDKSLNRLDTWLQHVQPYQLQARMLSNQELQAHFPDSTVAQNKNRTALMVPEDGYAEPQSVAPSIARQCANLGGHLFSDCAALAVETTAGQVSEVVTERGSIRCSYAVVAGGAWSSRFLRHLKIDLPQLNLLSSALRTGPVAGNVPHAIWTSGYSARKRADGGLTVATGHYSEAEIVPDSFRYLREFVPALKAEWSDISLRVGRRTAREFGRAVGLSGRATSPYQQERILDPKPAVKQTTASFERFKAEFPMFADVPVEQVWGGLVDVTPDAIPVISAAETVPGLHIATGFSAHGFGIAPGAGCLMADIVTASEPVVDPHAFRLSRFSDGTRIEIDI